MAKGSDLEAADQDAHPVIAWIDLDAHAGLKAVTVETQSEDAFTDDRYAFDAKGRLASLARTGHYINDPFETFYFYPGPDGRLVQPAEGKAIAKRSHHQTYWLDWDRYDRLPDMPFAKLFVVQGRKVIVKPGCSAPAKSRARRR